MLLAIEPSLQSQFSFQTSVNNVKSVSSLCTVGWPVESDEGFGFFLFFVLFFFVAGNNGTCGLKRACQALCH